jgi:hypothetical protein
VKFFFHSVTIFCYSYCIEAEHADADLFLLF